MFTAKKVELFYAMFWSVFSVKNYTNKILFKLTLVGHFVLSPIERKKEIEDIVEEMKERDREERGKLMKEETEEIKTFPLYPYLLQG